MKTFPSTSYEFSFKKKLVRSVTVKIFLKLATKLSVTSAYTFLQ